ncbi:MAG: VanZ family protein [Lachnospiraceae bacterium]|nr:VanZ family protein [Lachnospiraceae bacterium]
MTKRITGITVIVWMAVIFAFSAQPALQSSEASHSVSYKIAEWQNRLFGQEKTEEQLAAQAESMQFIIRKGAHMGEYAFLAFLLCVHLSCYDVNRRKAVLLSLGLTACYAASDEIHQLFVPGRAGRMTDVCIDTAGGGIGIVLFLLILYFRKKIRFRHLISKTGKRR